MHISPRGVASLKVIAVGALFFVALGGVVWSRLPKAQATAQPQALRAAGDNAAPGSLQAAEFQPAPKPKPKFKPCGE